MELTNILKVQNRYPFTEISFFSPVFRNVNGKLLTANSRSVSVYVFHRVTLTQVVYLRNVTLLKWRSNDRSRLSIIGYSVFFTDYNTRIRQPTLVCELTSIVHLFIHKTEPTLFALQQNLRERCGIAPSDIGRENEFMSIHQARTDFFRALLLSKDTSSSLKDTCYFYKDIAMLMQRRSHRSSSQLYQKFQQNNFVKKTTQLSFSKPGAFFGGTASGKILFQLVL